MLTNAGKKHIIQAREANSCAEKRQKTRRLGNVSCDASGDLSMILGNMDREAFTSFHAESTDDRCPDIPEQERKFLSDEKVLRIMEEQWGCADAAEFERLPGDKRTDALRCLLKAGGSIRQVSRLTGVSVGIVRKTVWRTEAPG